MQDSRLSRKPKAHRPLRAWKIEHLLFRAKDKAQRRSRSFFTTKPHGWLAYTASAAGKTAPLLLLLIQLEISYAFYWPETPPAPYSSSCIIQVSRSCEFPYLFGKDIIHFFKAEIFTVVAEWKRVSTHPFWSGCMSSRVYESSFQIKLGSSTDRDYDGRPQWSHFVSCVFSCQISPHLFQLFGKMLQGSFAVRLHPWEWEEQSVQSLCHILGWTVP